MPLQRLLLAIWLLGTAASASAVSVAGYASRDDVTVGQVFSVNVVVVNNQPTAISDVRISIARPTEVAAISNHTDAVCNPGNCGAGAQINWTQASLAPGETYVATFKTSLNAQANTPGTVVTFPVAVSGAGVSLANASVQVRSKGADLAATTQRLRLSISSTVLMPGEEAVVVASLGNTSSSTISFGNALTIAVPAGLEPVEAIGGSITGQQAQWSIGAINPQAGLQHLLVVRARPDSAAQAATLQATLQSAGESSTARQVLAIQPLPRLRVFIEPERSWGRNGFVNATQVRVENHGGATLNQVALRARIAHGSGGSRYPSDAPSACAGSCSAGAEVVWDVGSLPPGASRVYTYRDLISSNNSGASLVGESLRMEALASSASGRALATADVVVVTGDSLDLKVNPALTAFPLGSPVPVEVVIGNPSTTTVSLGTTIDLRLPAGLSVIDADGGTPTATGLRWTVGAINPLDSRVRHVLLQADGSSGYTPPWDRLFRHGFEPSDAVPAPGALLAMASNSAGMSRNTFRHHGAFTDRGDPLRAKVVFAHGSAMPGERINGEVTVSNIGAHDVAGAMVHLRVPAGNSSISLLSDGGTGASTCCMDGGEFVTWPLGVLPAGAHRTMSFSVGVRSAAEPGLAQTYEAWVTGNNGVDHARSAEVLTLHAATDLRLAVETDRDIVQPGDLLTYTLGHGNASTTSTSAQTLALILPEGLEFVSASDGGALEGRTVGWSIGTAQPGGSGRRQATVRVLDGPHGSLLSATALLGDSASRVAHADSVTAIQAAPVLTMAMSLLPGPVSPGGYLQGVVTVANNGDVDVFGATAHLRVPLGTSSLSNLSDSGAGSSSCCMDGGEFVTWTLGQLPAGATRHLSFATRLRTSVPAGDVLRYSAWARANNGVARASASHLMFVRATPSLRLAAETSHDAVQMGDTLTYTLTYGNAGVSASPSSTLRLPVPAGAGFTSATGGGQLIGDEIVWALGALPAAQSGQRQATFAVTQQPEGHLLDTAASLTDASSQFAHLNVINHVETAAALDVALTMSAGAVSPGGTFTGQVAITNTDAVDLFGVHLYLRVPAGTNAIQNLSDGGTGGGSCCMDGGEYVTWSLGSLAAGATRTVTFSTQLRSSVAPGEVLVYETWARASNGLDHARQQRVVRVPP